MKISRMILETGCAAEVEKREFYQIELSCFMGNYVVVIYCLEGYCNDRTISCIVVDRRQDTQSIATTYPVDAISQPPQLFQLRHGSPRSLVEVVSPSADRKLSPHDVTALRQMPTTQVGRL